MKLHNLFARLYAPEDDLAGGGAAGAGSDPASGGDAAGADPAPTMDDTARNTYRALMNAGGGDDDAGGPAPDDKPAQQRQRGADGKFAKAGEAAAADPAADPAAPDVAAPAQTKPHDTYPNTWGKDLEGEWAKLPESVRERIHKREQDFHNGVKQYKDAAGFGASMAQEMLPYQQVMREKGVTPQSAVRDIMGALNTMVTGSEETKAQTFLRLATDYGINLSTVLSLSQRSPAQAAPELAPVLQRMSQLETRIQQADQDRERLQREEDDAHVQAFIADPKNEHARTVAKQMGALLISGQAKDLQDAYEQAMWVHPEVRAKLLEKQEAERRKKEADEAAAARKASGANVTRKGTPPTPAKPGKMEDTARSVYRKLMN